MFEFRKIDETQYECFDDYRYVYFYRRKNPTNLSKEDNKNRFAMKTTALRDDAYFGEVVGSVIARRTIRNACRAELAKRRGFGDNFENGVISYYYFAENDSPVTSNFVLNSYCKNNGINIKASEIPYNPTIESSLKAIAHYIIYICKRPISEYEVVKQQFIDMIIFDCKFGNFDRNTDNWMLYRNNETDKVLLYPLFDNEAVLGFCEEVYSKEMPVNSILDYCEKLPTKYRISYKGESKFSSFGDVITYMVKTYPNETNKAIKKVDTFSLEDLSSLLDQFPDMSEERKVFTKKMFLTRQLLFNKYKDIGLEERNSIKEIKDE